jgi:phage terminase large subunit
VTTALQQQPDEVVEFRGAVGKLMVSTDPEICLSGAAGTGKSWAALMKIHATSMNIPGLRSLVVRRTHASLTGTTLVTYEQQVAAHALAVGDVRWYGGSARKPPAYQYRNGSEILVGGLDRPEKFLSSEFDKIFIDEANEVDLSAYETLISRLRGTASPHLQIITCTNPDRPTHWLKARADSGTLRMLNSRHEDNPALFHEGALTERGTAYMSKLDALTGVRYLRLRRGVWAAAEGLVYDEYDPFVHLIDRFEIPDDWPRYWVIDWGFVNPTVVQWWAEDRDGRLYLYREIYVTGRLTEDIAKDVLAQVQRRDGTWKEPRPVAVICDHDAEDRATFTRHTHLPTTAAKKTKTKGIQAVQSRLKVQKDGKPRIFFLRDSVVKRDQSLVDSGKPTSTVDEITGYVWPVGKVGDKAEEPVKEDDHGCDCFRYMVSHKDLKARYETRML